MIISTTVAPKPYVETQISKISKHCELKSSYCNSPYRNIDIKDIEPANYIKPLSLSFHIEPALDKRG